MEVDKEKQEQVERRIPKRVKQRHSEDNWPAEDPQETEYRHESNALVYQNQWECRIRKIKLIIN